MTDIIPLEITPSYTFPVRSGDGNKFMARPIAQWRKQLKSSMLSQRRMSMGMPMDLPGSTVIVESNDILCQNCNGSNKIITEIKKDAPCKTCNPIKLKTAFVDSSSNHITTENYLHSRCHTYSQNEKTVKKEGIEYFNANGIPIEPSNSVNGTQNRQSTDCYNNKCNTTIFKPNNTQYAQQGGVSSSSRISRLKYNTLNNYGAAFNSASGAVNINSGRYQTEPSPSYYNKYKPQQVISPRKNGASNYCPSYSICMNE